jgi:hypothetical protein
MVSPALVWSRAPERGNPFQAPCRAGLDTATQEMVLEKTARRATTSVATLAT